MPLTSSGSPMISAMVMRGLSEENGSWKIICICRRSGRSALRSSVATSMSCPLAAWNRISPPVGAIARRMQREVVVLPQPDSPTSDSVSPRAMVKLTSSTARTAPASRRTGRCGSESTCAGLELPEPLPARSCRDRRPLGQIQMAGGRVAFPDRHLGCGNVLSQVPRMKSGQRGWNGQPRGPRERMRNRAGDRRQPRPRLAPAPTGSSAAAPAYTDARGAWKIASTGPFSTSWPRYITTTSSAISAITPMSWVIRITASPRSCCKSPDQFENLRLRGHVQRGGRLIGDQDARLGRQRQRDHHPLAQPAGQFERIRIDPLRRARNADHRQQFDRPRPRRALRQRRMQPDRLDELVADGVERRQRRSSAPGTPGRSRRRGSRASALRRTGSLVRSTTDPSARRSMISPPTMRPGRSTMRRMERAVTLLPQPDSPTMPSVCPGNRSNEVPSTARTVPSSATK